MKHETLPSVEPSASYDIESAQAEWGSLERAQELAENYVRDGSNVLDIGIGTGQSVAGYMEKGARIIGIDRDESMLESAQNITGEAGAMRLGDINEQLPVEDLEGQVDVVQAIGVLEFAEDIEGVFDQVVPTIKEGGVFVFTVETPGGDGSGSPERLLEMDNRISHSPEEIYKLLTSKSLDLVREEAYGGGDADSEKVSRRIFLAQKHESFSGADIEDEDASLLFEDSPLDESWQDRREQQMSSYYINPEEAAAARAADGMEPIDENEFNKWIDSLTLEEKGELDEQRAAIAAKKELQDSVREKLRISIPDLYKGKLPRELENKLEGSPYAIGFNQSMASSASEASDYLHELEGIDITGYNYDQRFLMFDATSELEDGDNPAINQAIESGYTGESVIGRFVTAFPAENSQNIGENDDVAHIVNAEPNVLPEDFESQKIARNGESKQAVSSKYVAGFIDGEGDFWVNANFMISNESKLIKSNQAPEDVAWI